MPVKDNEKGDRIDKCGKPQCMNDDDDDDDGPPPEYESDSDDEEEEKAKANEVNVVEGERKSRRKTRRNYRR